VAVLAVLASTDMPVSAQTLTVDTVGDALKIRVVGFSFLKGEPIARLKDGRTVRVELAAMILPGAGKPAAATVRRIFALSYDLWEERFAVTMAGPRAQSVSHLALAAVEGWCIQQLAIPLTALSRDAPFWVRFEYRILDGDTASDSPDSGYTLQALIDLLSRRRQAASAEYVLEAGPFRAPRGPSAPR
jgi:hypothetical protein